MYYTINSKSNFIFHFFIVVLLTALFLTTPITADTLNVPSEAYPTIQSAIDAAGSGDIVQVAAGTYYGTITHKSGVHVLGAGKTVTTIDGQNLGAVVTAENVNSAAKLDGFTITNGSGFSTNGGGIHLSNGDLVISNCVITDNHTSGSLAKGGGIYCTSGSSATIQDCEITLNSSKHGGGIYINDCSPSILNCLIEQNSATGDYKGGGLFCTGSSTSSSIIDCIVSNNGGNGIYCGIYSHPTIENCTITDNHADNGAGVRCYGSTPSLINTVIADNNASEAGGGMYSYSRDPKIMNCVLYNNSGGGIYYFDCSPILTNSILWANTWQIYTPASDTIDVSYCDIEGGYTGTGNIDQSPDFVDASSGDFHLQMTSPCINKGTDAGAPEYDFESDPRLAPVGGDNVPDMGVDETTYFPNPPSDLQAYQTGDRIHLTWQDNSDDETGFRIESKIGVGTWQTLGTVDPDTTFYQAAFSLNFEYFYRVVAFNANGDSMYSNEVSIYTAGLLNWLRVDEPNGGEDWPEQSTQTIIWANGMLPPDYVNLYYSTDTQCTWQLIEANVPNTGSYSWMITATPSETCLVKVESAASSAIYDLSNEYFSITASPYRFEFIEDSYDPVMWWFGGDDRAGWTRNKGYGQSFTLPRSAHVDYAGFAFFEHFDYYENPTGSGHDVTLVLDIRNQEGTIIKTVSQNVPSSFDGGWVLFDVDMDLWAGEKYIYTCFLQDGHINNLKSSIRGREDDPWPESQGYYLDNRTAPYDMKEWSNWSMHLWDFNFRLAGIYTDRSRADFNIDGVVGLRDLATLTNNWLRLDCQMPDWCENTDLDWNNTIEFADFAIFAEDWLFVGYQDINAADIAAMEDQMSTANIDGSDGNEFWPGTYFIYKTNLGRYGKFIVENFDKSQNNQLMIAWVTYEGDGSVYSSGSGLIIQGTQSCDLDEGQEGPPAEDCDWGWVQSTSTTRWLDPRNGAKFKLVYRAD